MHVSSVHDLRLAIIIYIFLSDLDDLYGEVDVFI